MKKKISLLLAFVMLFSFAACAAPAADTTPAAPPAETPAATPEPIEFNDPNLEAAIREELGIKDRAITTEDALGVTKLDLG